MIYILILTYCTAAFGLHGGQLATGVNRQARNAICALPFALVGYATWGIPAGAVWFILSFVGSNIGHENFWSMGEWESTNRPDNALDWIVKKLGFKFNTLSYDTAGMALKGFITCPPGGFVTLPLAYYVGMRTKWNNVFCEFASGFLYGVVLCVVMK